MRQSWEWKLKQPTNVEKDGQVPWQFWQAGHDCHDHRRRVPSGKSGRKKTGLQQARWDITYKLFVTACAWPPKKKEKERKRKGTLARPV